MPRMLVRSAATFGSPVARPRIPSPSQRPVDRVDARPPHRVHAMGERVQSGRYGHLSGKGGEERGVVDDRGRQDPPIHPGGLGLAFGQAPDVGGLGAGVGGRYGDNRQAGGQRDGLGQSRGRAAAHTHQHVGIRGCGGLAGPLCDRDRDVHDHLVVALHDQYLLRDRVRELRLAVGGDQHHP